MNTSYCVAKHQQSESLARVRSIYAPIHIRLFGPNTVMFEPNNIADLLEQFGFVLRRRARYPFWYGVDYGVDSAVFNPELKPD